MEKYGVIVAHRDLILLQLLSYNFKLCHGLFPYRC
jgi:hypothetical protein